MNEPDQDDEGWIWLPHEERMVLERQKNALLRSLLDNAAVARGPLIEVGNTGAKPLTFNPVKTRF